MRSLEPPPHLPAYKKHSELITQTPARISVVSLRKSANICPQNISQQPNMLQNIFFNNMIKHDVPRPTPPPSSFQSKIFDPSPMWVQGPVYLPLSFPSYSLFTIIFNFIVAQQQCGHTPLFVGKPKNTWWKGFSAEVLIFKLTEAAPG